MSVYMSRRILGKWGSVLFLFGYCLLSFPRGWTVVARNSFSQAVRAGRIVSTARYIQPK